jgi:diaminohydroxyphosphoribosylaminopyrimidine deaminase / 5-amino-6-(5-phosphoribosylamino)uracil reductase
MDKHDQHIHELFMKRVFELASIGRGDVSPNPMVGSVVVHAGKIIGEGWHKKYGGPHAEVNAIRSVDDKSVLKESTVYVNLEPCSHFGKTPPCADMLIAHQVKKVVVANLDSNPLVAGQGMEKLRQAGIDVVVGILDKEGRDFNRRFFTYIEKQRPYIILKWAQTSDGFIARENYDSKWISNEYSRQLVHQWRAEEDAVLVGMKTALHDNPKLNVRDWSGRNPTRVVIDRFLSLPQTLNLFDGSQPTFCYNVIKDDVHANLCLKRIAQENFIENMLEDLRQEKIQSLIIEGGAQTLKLFIEAGLWDEARIFIGKRSFGKGISAPKIAGSLASHRILDGDILNIYKPLPQL